MLWSILQMWNDVLQLVIIINSLLIMRETPLQILLQENCGL